jgi:hypothetical protein
MCHCRWQHSSKQIVHNGQLFKEICIEMQGSSVILMYSLILILLRLQKLVIPILYMWVDLSKVEN